MGALRKAGVWLGLIEDEDDRHYDGHGYDDDFEDEADEVPVAVRPRAAVAERLAEAREAGRTERATTERATIRPASRPSSTTSYPTRDNLALAPQVQLRERAVVTEDEERRYQITTLHPTTYNEARTIGEHFRDGVPVIMNLTEMAEADAKRLVDFAAGLAFGLRGTMERVTNRVFLLSPANVQVTAEDKARIAEGGFFNQS
jgi:cell division inhibitor SepF